MVKITKFAQSNFLIEANNKKLLVDPGNFNADKYSQPQDFFKDISALIITHKHPDHFDQSVVKNIFYQSHPIILTTQENVGILAPEGVETRVFKIGEFAAVGPFKIRAVAANHHGRWGEIAGRRIDAFGAVVLVEGKTFYHTSDTVPPIANFPTCEVIFVPIGDRNVFTIAEAVDFVKNVKPKIAIPMHYDDPQDKNVNPADFAQKLAGSEIEVKILQFGESLEI